VEPAGEGGPKRVRAKGARTMEELKSAAREVFRRSGYLNATVPDIAKAAGKSPAAFYKYFESKRALLELLLKDFIHEFDVRSGLPAAADLSRFEDLYTAVESFWHAYAEYRVEWVSAIQASAVDPEFLDLWLSVRDTGVRAIARTLRTAADRGQLPPGLDPVVAASNLSAMLEHSCYLWIGLDANAVGRPRDDEEAITSIATLWHRAIRTTPDR
jgi:AcrR family transcriptional regulator